ncbi:glycosyltransferase [Klebsiella pneumoniae]|nr:glycosyltransferase [Klebsiella pneumoniae]
MCYKRKVAAVVVTYNRVELLKRAIDALLAQSVELEYIVVVNNNSSDATKDYLDSNQNKKIMPIHLSTNTGGAGGFSAGISFAHGLGVDYIWIMDDDAIPDINALSELLLADEHLEKNILKVDSCVVTLLVMIIFV